MAQEATAVNLANLGNGIAQERFNHELDKVMANIKDVNTDPDSPRSITLKVTFVPYGDRSGMQTVIDSSCKLATVPKVSAGPMFILKNKSGELQAYSHDIRQDTLFSEPEAVAEPASDNVVSMTKQA